MYLAGLYQQQRESFLIRYRVAAQTPSIASLYLYALLAKEPAICAALYSRLKTATNRYEIRFLVAIFMAAFRVTLEEWLKNEAQGDLVALVREDLERFSSLSRDMMRIFDIYQLELRLAAPHLVSVDVRSEREFV